MKRLTIAIAVLLALGACTPKSTATSTNASSTQVSSGDFAVTATFAPDPPKQGPSTITVTVKDPSGNSVKGAKVKIATNMPEMSMMGPDLAAQDNGDGTYSAQTNLNYQTKWVFDVTVSAAGKSAKLHKEAAVK